MRTILVACILAISSSVYAADVQAAYPDEYALRPLQLPTGMAQLRVPVVFNLSKNSVAKPVFIPFEVRFGLTSELELRIFHPGHGACISGKSKGCDRVYNDLAFGMLYSLSRSRDLDVAFLGAVELNSLASPVTSHLDMGIALKYVHAPMSIAVDPYLSIALTHRDWSGDWINIPAEFAFQLSGLTALFVESGIYGDAHHFGSSWSMPVGIGLNLLLARGVDMGFELKLNRAIGNGSTTDDRIGLVYFTLRG